MIIVPQKRIWTRSMRISPIPSPGGRTKGGKNLTTVSSGSLPRMRWDGDNSSPNYVLSNSDLTATKTAGDAVWQSVVALSTKSTGKWYVEIYLNYCQDAFHMIGVVEDAFTAATQYPGQTAASYGYQGQSGNKYNNAAFSAYGAAYGTTDTIVSVALDLDNGKIWWAKDGVWQAAGDPAAGTNFAYSGLSGNKRFAWASWQADNSQATLTLAKNYAYTAPTGFKNWK